MYRKMAVQFTACSTQHIIATDASVVWEPSVFGGNGSENRLNLVLRVTEDVIKSIRAAEQGCSATVISDETVKVKVEMDKLNIWGSDNTPAPKPTQWRGVEVKAKLEIRGFWKSVSGEGICVVCTDLQISDAKPKTSPF